MQMEIVKKGEVLYQSCYGELPKIEHIPRIGEHIALHKWDNLVYVVKDVFTVFSPGDNEQTIKIEVEIV